MLLIMKLPTNAVSEDQFFIFMDERFAEETFGVTMGTERRFFFYIKRYFRPGRMPHLLLGRVCHLPNLKRIEPSC